MAHGHTKHPFFCTYCGKQAATVDHCPPKLLFPVPLPANLETVPSCLACNLRASKDEEYFRAVLLLTECGETGAGERLWADKAGRALQRNNGLVARIQESMKWQDVKTEGGIALGKQTTMTVEQERLRVVVMKIARGLYLKEFGTRLDPSAAMLAQFLVSQNLYDTVEKRLPHLRWGKFQWPAHMTMWVLRFYGTAFFMVGSAPAATLATWIAEWKAARERSLIYIPGGFATAE